MKLSASQIAAIGAEADRIRAPYGHVAAVVEVESNGVVSAGLIDARKPVIRWEGHYFDRRLTGAARAEARRLGLSSPRVGGVKNPKSQAARYALLQRAIDLCKKHRVGPGAAYESASWGIGQVMGANWHDLGYKSAEEFVAVVSSGFAGQLRVMMQFIAVNKLDDELRDGRWASFARGYNGPAYAANKYDTKLAAAAERHGGVSKPADGFLRMGSKGARVRELQSLLVTAGFSVKIDGDFGPATLAAVKAFQTGEGITVDGVYGPETERRLSTFRVDPDVVPGQQNVADIEEVKAGVVGGGGAAVILISIKEVLEDTLVKIGPLTADSAFFASIQGGLTVAVAAATLAGLGYSLYGFWKSRKTVEV